MPGRSARRSGSRRPPRCWRASSSAGRSPRIAASRRTWSASPPTRAPCVPPGSACRPGRKRRGQRLDVAATAELERLPAPSADEDRARPGEHDRGRVRRSCRRRRARSARPPPLGATAPRLPSGALRGAPAPRPRPPPGRPGAAGRRGRDGDASLAPALRRLPGSDRQRARRRRARARARRSGGVPPPAARAARRRGGRRGARLLAGARALLPQLRLGAAARGRHAAHCGRSTGSCGGADRARAALQSRSTSWALTLPAEELREAERDATVAGRRLLLVGGEAAALLIAFAVLAAGALRRDLAAARRRLTWNGATAAHRRLLTGTESAAVGFGGAALGWLVGSLAGAAAATAAGASATAVLAESVLSPLGLLLGARRRRWAPRSSSSSPSRSSHGAPARFGLAELAAVAAARRGARHPREWRRGRRRARRGRVGAARASPPAGARRVRRCDRRRAAPARRRAAARPQGDGERAPRGRLPRSRTGCRGIAAAFLALAIGLAALAESYRSTLARGERDRAAFALPTDVVVRENLRALVPVLRARPLERYRAPARRRGGASDRARNRERGSGVLDLRGHRARGVSPEAVESMPLWRDDWGLEPNGAHRDDRGRRLGGAQRATSSGGRRLRLAVDPGLVSYLATIEQRDGSFRTLDLGAADAGRPVVLATGLPAASRGGKLVAITLRPPRLGDRGADSGVALRGRTSLRVVGVSLDDWVGQGGVTIARNADPGALDLPTPSRTSGRRASGRGRSTDGKPPAAVVTTRLGQLAGGVGGTLPLRVGESRSGRGRRRRRSASRELRRRGARRPRDASHRGLERGSRPRAGLRALARRRTGRGVRGSRRRSPAGRSPCSRRARGRERRRTRAATRSPTARCWPWAPQRSSRSSSRSQDSCSRSAPTCATTAASSPISRPRARHRASCGGRSPPARASSERSASREGSSAGLVLAVLVTRVVAVTARADAPEPPLVTTVDPLLLGLAGVAVTCRRSRARPPDDEACVRRSPGPGSDGRRRVTAIVELRGRLRRPSRPRTEASPPCRV